MAQTVVTVHLPADELYTLQPTADGDTVTWWCRLCTGVGDAQTASLAQSGAVGHLAAEHRATIDYTNDPPE